jgi:transcriptional regulator with AAA-type ATPase domain
MRAFATDEQNRMTIRRIGDSKERKIKLKALILATNRTIDELKQVLLPDFFDRIAQLIIELPPLRETPEEIIPGFKEIWKGLKFETAYPFDDYPGKDKRLLNWIKSLPLYGNYRDLQRIAINYKAYLEFDKKTISLLPEKSAFEFTKNQFEKYMLNSETHQQPNPYFDENKTPNQALALFKKDYVAWAKKRFGTLKNAVRHFNQLKENNITYRTLQNWSKTK